MKKLIVIIAVFCFSLLAIAENNIVFREPFTLKLHIDKEHYYEQEINNRVPYVHNNSIYLFVGESFGINIKINNEEITEISYQKDIDKSDIELKFSQEINEDSSAITLLVIKNKTENKIFMDASMTIPEKKGVYQTTILPLEPGLSGYESWPHAIVQLVLKNIRLKK